MHVRNLALISEVEDHEPADVSRVAAALQRQATRDFGPVWDVAATVDVFPSLADVPIGYWPMIVRTDIEVEGADGIHLDEHNQPFALITYSDSWSLTASHEMCEMIVDPGASKMVPGPSPKPDQGRVSFLVEVCDPSEAAEFGYTVNDILVSDFYTPHFFDPVAAEGVRYSFTGAIEKPREVLRGGYLSWLDPISNHLWQERWFDAEPEFVDLTAVDPGVKSLREEVDRRTPHPQLTQGLDSDDETLRAAVAAGEGTVAAAAARAERLQAQVATIVAGG